MSNIHRHDLHFDANEKQQIFAAIDIIRNVLAPKLVQLNPEDRRRYGSINEENKKVVNKVKDYHEFAPQLSAPEVDWQEFSADYEDRSFLEFVATSLNSLSYEVESTKIVHDYNNMQDARADYAFAKYRAERNIIGAAQKARDLAQFFAKNNNRQDDKEETRNNNENNNTEAADNSTIE